MDLEDVKKLRQFQKSFLQIQHVFDNKTAPKVTGISLSPLAAEINRLVNRFPNLVPYSKISIDLTSTYSLTAIQTMIGVIISHLETAIEQNPISTITDNSSISTSLPVLNISSEEKGKQENIDHKKVFVVHGRNIQLRNSLFDFLRAIGLSPIEWNQAIAITNKGTPSIGEILDAAFSQAQAVVVLLSGDDETRLRKQFLIDSDEGYEKQLTPQCRPNVLFEAGMSMGRYPDRTVLIQIGQLRPWSDIGGRHITHLDNSAAKRQELTTKLKNAGCEIDTTGTDWYTCGDFNFVYIIDNSNFKVGDHVRHPTFGDGIITKIEGSENSEQVAVAFEGNGVKNLLLRFAKLKKIE
jgi:predicted nucleotide-binding protein